MENQLTLLESTWDSSRNLKWVKTFTTNIIESYKECRNKLKETSTEQRYHEHILDLHQALKDHYQALHVTHKFDLAGMRYHCRKFLEYYEKISELDRDSTTIEAKNGIDETLNALNEEISKFSEKLDTASIIQYIELCIVLGKVSNNVKLQQQLDQYSGVDKPDLQQLIRSFQLIGLLKILEENALEQMFKGIPMTAAQTDLLERGRQLNAKEGQSSEGGHDGEQILFGGEKEDVKALIETSVVDKKSLRQIKDKITGQLGRQLGPVNTAFVENEFKICCKRQCKMDITSSIVTFFDGKSEEFLLNIFYYLNTIKNVNAIPLTIMGYYKNELPRIITNAEEQELVNHFKKECLKRAADSATCIKNEIIFIKSLTDYLSLAKNLTSICNEFGIQRNYHQSIPQLKYIFQKIMASRGLGFSSKLSSLQNITEIVAKQNHIFLEEKIRAAIEQIITPTTISETHTGDRWVIEVVGRNVVLSEVLSSLEREIAKSYCQQVNFVCDTVFHIDANLSNNIWNGINVAVRSKLIQVHGNVTWNVSGLNNYLVFGRDAGTDSAGNGLWGSSGFPGGSGGNVLILAEKMDNANLLTILANGGNGSNGQNGGNGADGQNGIGLTQEKMDADFKSPVYGRKGFTKPDYTINQMVSRMNIVSWDTYKENSNNCYFEGLNAAGNRIILSYTFTPLYRAHQCYFLYKGSAGKPGKLGGRFGIGGQGGFPGTITVQNIQDDAHFGVRKTAIRGQDGWPGVGGVNGKMGKDGWDMGYNHHEHWSSPVGYGLDRNSKLSLRKVHENRSNTVYCWRNDDDMSFDIQAISSPQNSNVRNSGGCYLDSYYATKKLMIDDRDFISKTAQRFNVRDGENWDQILNLAENLRLRAIESSK